MENNYQLSRIHNYVNGLMNKEDMHALEREALDDPFLQDAIDGYKLQNGVDTKQLSLLQQRLASRVEESVSQKNKRFYNWQRLAVGLAAGVMFVTVCTLLLMRYLPQQKAEGSLELKEVVIKDYFYDFDITPDNSTNDVLPVQGWGDLHKALQNYSNSSNFEGKLSVSFKVSEAHKAYDIIIKGNNYQADEELEDIIRNKVKWSGQQANFTIEIFMLHNNNI